MKICINGTIRDMTVEEIKELKEVEAIQEEKPSTSFEERIAKLEKILEKLGLNK